MAATAEAHLTHVLSARQFDRPFIEEILARAAALDRVRDHRLAGKILAALFFEPSTRTRLSFESAMVRRGGSVIGTEAAGMFSSAAKGETLADTVRVVSEYADVIVLRHPSAGSAQAAASVATVPVINAGDGDGEHPSQALLDLLTIQRECGGIDGKHIIVCGDLRHARTVHSLALMAANFDVKLTCVAPSDFALPQTIVREVAARGIEITHVEGIDTVIGGCDVLYQTRLQRERLTSTDAATAPGFVVVDRDLMRRLPRHAIVMQPLPRVDDISPDVDADPRAAYFRQAANGVTLRMALLEYVIG